MSVKVKLRNAIVKAVELKAEEEQATTAKKEQYNKVLQLMDEEKITEAKFEKFEGDGEDKTKYKAIIVESHSTKWDAEKIQKVCPEAIVNDIRIDDWTAFVNELKAAGVTKEDLENIKKKLTVTKTVNEKVLDNELALGNIKEKQVKPAMKLIPKARFVKISEK